MDLVGGRGRGGGRMDKLQEEEVEVVPTLTGTISAIEQSPATYSTHFGLHV